VTFHHGARHLDPGQVDGITIGGVVLDVPDPLHGDIDQARAALQARAGARQAVLALGPDDVETAVSRGLAR
jgi:hypothetical protein